MRIGISIFLKNTHKSPIFNHKSSPPEGDGDIQASKDLVDASMAVFALFSMGEKRRAFFKCLARFIRLEFSKLKF